jgi:hypothetical protein
LFEFPRLVDPYQPPAFFWWWFAYDASARDIFVEGACIAASGGIAAVVVAIAMSVWRAREAKRVTTYGSARWAETREVRKADRRSSTTSRAKTGRLSPAGGRGSAACFCSIRPMRRALLTIRYWRATAGAPLFVRSVHDFEFNRGPLGARSYSFEAVSPAPIAAAGDGRFLRGRHRLHFLCDHRLAGRFRLAERNGCWLNTSAELGIIALAVGVLMIAGEFDLSISSVIGAISIILAIARRGSGSIRG